MSDYDHPVPDCICGHSWEDHHHGAVLNPDYPSDDHAQGIHAGWLAEECEYYGFNEWGGLDNEGNKHCQRYRAASQQEKEDE